MEESIKGSWIDYLREKLSLEETDLKTFSPLTLAFIGDGIYDLIIRTMTVERGNAPVSRLHKRVSALVKAGTQMKMMLELEPCLTAEEEAVYKRGRNAKSYTTAHNATIQEYRIATGLEALFGYLYLSGQMDRLLELVKEGLKKIGEWPEER